MTEAELQRLENLASRATRGPWVASVEGRDHTSGSSCILTQGDDLELIAASEADYDFIAAAREGIPKLIAEVRRLRGLSLRD